MSFTIVYYLLELLAVTLQDINQLRNEIKGVGQNQEIYPNYSSSPDSTNPRFVNSGSCNERGSTMKTDVQATQSPNQDTVRVQGSAADS